LIEDLLLILCERLLIRTDGEESEKQLQSLEGIRLKASEFLSFSVVWIDINALLDEQAEKYPI
jgi:hypothetical protein